MARDFSEALSRMLHLDTLVVWLQSDHYSPHRFAGHVREISHNPNLKHIHLLLKLRHSFESIDSQQRLHDEFKGDPRMTALLDLPDERPSLWKRTEMDSSHGSLAYPARLAADGRQEDIIWDRVLFYALRAEIPGLPQKEDGFSRIRVHGISPSEIRFRRLYPLAVCKMFARLGLRHLYAIVVLDHDFAAHSLASQLNRRPELGLHVQGLYLDFHHIDAACYDHRGVTWKAFRDFAGVSGAQLQMLHGLQISDSVSTVNPNTLALFSQISNFYRDSIVKFNIAPSFAPPRTTFSTLTKLIIDKFDESFFDVLANMELPVLHTVFLESLTLCGGAAFFRMHGQKLRELKLSERQLNMRNIAIWRNCPLLTTLRIICDKKHFVQDTCLTTSETLPCLEQIFFEVLNRYDKLTTQEQIPHFNRLINALRTTKSFPALREVHHPLCKWPTTEHGKDTWSKWAEKLLTRDASVHLVGPDGVRWRPRMQVPKQPRRGRNVGLSKSK
ncbi:hypothetical protein R3P38DRAFT_964169 [Favolaschia claudopus]|uniref:Uncharacterized protein n=1 Tax=Favolaschia claudopus TaxID=2862362 RepID=A0AAW0E5I3_9AGAR